MNKCWNVFLAGVVSTVATVGLASNALAQEFTVAAWGGKPQDNLRRNIFRPFAESHNINVRDATYLGGWGQFKAMQKTGAWPWDAVIVESSVLKRGCEQGVFAELDWRKIGKKALWIDEATTRCGLGQYAYAVVLSYDKNEIDGAPPKTLSAFWNVEKWPGRRGMRQGPKLNLELALMADGVSPGNVYDVLSTEAGVDRAFAKLDEIKSEVQWWDAGGQPPAWLASGDVTMTFAYNGRISNAQSNGESFGIIWDHAVYSVDSWAIPAGTDQKEMAYEFVRYAGQAKPQIAYAREFFYAPTRKSALDKLSANLRSRLPTGDKLDGSLFSGSAKAVNFWIEHSEQLTRRWNIWVNQ